MKRLFEQPWIWALLGVVGLWILLSIGTGQVNLGNLSGIAASAALLCVVAIGQMLLRTIYGAVRDKNWVTAHFKLEIGGLEQGENAFSLEFVGRYDPAAIPFWWKGTIKGDGGSLEVRFEGHVSSAFLRNRIGFCILHPIKECAGKPCRLQNGEGSFPEEIIAAFGKLSISQNTNIHCNQS